MSLVHLVFAVFLPHENLTNQLQIQLSFSQWGKGSELFRNLPKVLSSLMLRGRCLVTKLCPTLATPWTVACQAPLSMGFSRQAYWSGLPFPSPGDLPDPGIKPRSPVLQILYWLSYDGSHFVFPKGYPVWPSCTTYMNSPHSCQHRLLSVFKNIWQTYGQNSYLIICFVVL